MTRLLCAALLLACVAAGVAANNDTATPTPSPTSSSSPSLSSSSSSSKSTPSPTPSPRPVEFAAQSYVLKNESGDVCLRMSGYMNMTFNYTSRGNGANKSTYQTLVIPVSANVSDNSTCSSDPTGKENQANLIVYWSDGRPYTLEFHFKEDVAKKNWSLNTVRFNFSMEDNPDFYNYTQNNSYTHLEATHDKPIFDGVDLDNSFRCNTEQHYLLNVSNGTQFIYSIMTKFSTRDWRVQAFSFKKNPSNGTYDNPKLCDADAESRSKVVPIAVGCALAGLVIIVLVAYLIGRFRSRKHESYETLS